MGTTTIEITDTQKAKMDELKADGQSYKGFQDELIASYESAIASDETGDESRVREVAREEIRELVVFEALE